MEFADSWLWLIFIGVGLVLAALELIAGVETGFDLVVIGSVFIIGGLVTLPFHSWVPTVVVTSVICVAYVAVGRSRELKLPDHCRIARASDGLQSTTGMAADGKRRR